MKFQKAKIEDFKTIQNFYWTLIDELSDQNDKIGWKKGIYPSDDYIRDSLVSGELYILKDNENLCACVIVNSSCNEGYNGVLWSIDCNYSEVLIPHALAVNPKFQRKGIGKRAINEVLNLAKLNNKKAVRLDILGTNKVAESLYKSCGFKFVEEKNMFYEDTGWTKYKMFEYNL